MIEILHRYTKVLLYQSAPATTAKEALIEAVKGGACLGGAYLRGADLYGAYLRGADLYGADLGGADLYGADLRGAELGGAELGGADLGGAKLGGADLGGAKLGGADLYGADLRGADLGGAKLGGADLGGADLGGAKLGGADLRGAYLGGAKLGGADLGGAKGLLNGVTPLQVGGTRHWIIVREPGHITIGCHHKPLVWWEEHYKAVGREEQYTDAEVEEYRLHIAHCRQWMEVQGVDKIEEPRETLKLADERSKQNAQ